MLPPSLLLPATHIFCQTFPLQLIHERNIFPKKNLLIYWIIGFSTLSHFAEVAEVLLTCTWAELRVHNINLYPAGMFATSIKQGQLAYHCSLIGSKYCTLATFIFTSRYTQHMRTQRGGVRGSGPPPPPPPYKKKKCAKRRGPQQIKTSYTQRRL